MESVFNPLVQKLEGFVALDEADRDVLHRITAIARDVPARTNLAREGEPHSEIILITEGIGCRFKQRANGARQITAYLVPGDTCDLDITLLNRLDHTIATLSPCKVARISTLVLREITEDHPVVARAMRIAALIDEATLRGEPGGRADLDGGEPIAAETARRLCCDASLVALVERNGRPLSVGRKTRAIPPALRSWRMSAVTCVIANTNTRSKKSSRKLVRRSPSAAVSPLRRSWNV